MPNRLPPPRLQRYLLVLLAVGLIGGASALVVALGNPENRMTPPEDQSVLSRPAPAPDSTVAYGSEPEQITDVRVARPHPGAAPSPLVLIVHGGFWRPAYDRKHTGPMATALAEAGFTVASIEYRRIPGEPERTLADVALAIQTLPGKIPGHDGRVLLIGHSAGGHLVLWAAAAPRAAAGRLAITGVAGVVGVVALAPVADLRLAEKLQLGTGAVRAFLGGDAEAHADADPVRLPAPSVPVTVIHGTEDDTVPLDVGHAYVQAHPAARWVVLDRIGHYAVIDPLSTAWPAVVAELRRLTR